MALSFFIICTLFCFICGENVTSSKNASDTKVPKLTQQRIATVISEGGSMVSSSPVLKDQNMLLNIDKEITNMKKSSIKPRKEANIMSNEDSALPNLEKTNDKPSIDILKSNGSNATKNNDKNYTIPLTVAKLSVKLNTTDVPKHPKKPLLVSYDSLAGPDKDNYIAGASSKTHGKLHSTGASNKEVLILPIVLTTLIVPVFAVLSYFALKRGKEAWKNRHYKRMDFLLDGMYNE